MARDMANRRPVLGRPARSRANTAGRQPRLHQTVGLSPPGQARHTPRVTTLPETPQPPTSSKVVFVVAGLAAIVQLCRDASGALFLPEWFAAAAQFPLIALWVRRAILTRNNDDVALTALVALASIAVGVSRQSVDAAITAPTLFIFACMTLAGLRNAFRFIDAMPNDPKRMLRESLPAWFAVLLVAAAVLSLPIATRSSVPDYRHNLLLHVAHNAFAAVSAACLTGWTSYGYGDDYTRFGQAVLWLVTQFSGCLFAAVALAIMRPFLRRPISLRGLFIWAFALQAIVVALSFPQWAPRDTPTAAARIWWGTVHGADAMWNTGLILRPNGLAPYLLSGPIYALVTLVALAGSIGIPVIHDLIRGGPPLSDSKTPSTRNTVAPWLSLPAWEAGAAFWFLVAGAIILAVCESPGYMPDMLTFTRPFEFGMQQMSLRDDIGLPARASLAIHVSAMLRSAGIQSIALAEGGITVPSFVLMLGWMMVGGSIAGTAGGLRLSTLILPALYWFSNPSAWNARFGGPPTRASVSRKLILFALFWLVLCAATIGVLGLLTDGSTYQIVFDGVAALNNVGFTTGLIVHVSWPARIFLMVVMIAGRLIPLYFWAGISDRIQANTTS